MRNVIVTGASRGLGLAMTKRLVADGYRVIMAPSGRSYAVLQKGRAAAKRAAHGRFVPLCHVTSRHALAGCSAAKALTATLRTPGAKSRRVRGRPLPTSGTGAVKAGVPGKTVSVDDTPNAYGSCARCSVRRKVALSPNSASPNTAVTVIPLVRTCRSRVSASRHFSWKRTVAGMRAR